METKWEGYAELLVCRALALHTTCLNLVIRPRKCARKKGAALVGEERCKRKLENANNLLCDVLLRTHCSSLFLKTKKINKKHDFRKISF